MLKALLVSLAALVTFDAVAWDSRYRSALVTDVVIAVAQIEALDWSWG